MCSHEWELAVQEKWQKIHQPKLVHLHVCPSVWVCMRASYSYMRVYR